MDEVAEFCGMFLEVGGWVRVRMDDKGENMVWSASKVIIAVDVTKLSLFRIALILLLVDPLEYVLLVRHPCSL